MIWIISSLNYSQNTFQGYLFRKWCDCRLVWAIFSCTKVQRCQKPSEWSSWKHWSKRLCQHLRFTLSLCFFCFSKTVTVSLSISVYCASLAWQKQHFVFKSICNAAACNEKFSKIVQITSKTSMNYN